MQAENLKWKPTENLKSTRGHSFIIMDKVGDGGPETWERGLLIDPMDNKVVFLQEYAPPLMEGLMRIIGQSDKQQIQLSTNLMLSLPLIGNNMH